MTGSSSLVCTHATHGYDVFETGQRTHFNSVLINTIVFVSVSFLLAISGGV